MLLTGRHVVNAVPAKVWQMLMDTDTLARIVPGISKLEKNGNDSYHLYYRNETWPCE
jgi:carbon monoxide dehydrogenase subunit G